MVPPNSQAPPKHRNKAQKPFSHLFFNWWNMPCDFFLLIVTLIDENYMSGVSYVYNR